MKARIAEDGITNILCAATSVDKGGLGNRKIQLMLSTIFYSVIIVVDQHTTTNTIDRNLQYNHLLRPSHPSFPMVAQG